MYLQAKWLKISNMFTVFKIKPFPGSPNYTEVSTEIEILFLLTAERTSLVRVVSTAQRVFRATCTKVSYSTS